MPDYTPVNADNAAITLTAGQVITGGLLVKMGNSDDTVVHTTSPTADRPIGVAAHDAPSGGRVSIWLLPGFVHELPAENGVTPTTGAGVTCSTTPGRVNTTTLATTSNAPLIIGTFVRCTTGSTAATVRSRVLGF